MLDSVVGGGKEGTTIEPVEGGNKFGMLEKLDDRNVVRVSIKCVKEGERLSRWSRVMERKLSRYGRGKKGEKAKRYAGP